MDLYTKTSYRLSQILTEHYSTSFRMSSQLFSAAVRPHIYAVYGLVRIADEIVDTYQGKNKAELLNELERDAERAMKLGYDPNPLLHAFAQTAQQFEIGQELTKPFFDSMRLDLTPQNYTDALYREYIYGSAEVIGLMCLKVFVAGDRAEYDRLADGAKRLGAAYQKVNFLRDMREDYIRLGRVYFPGVNFETFDQARKREIEADIEIDFVIAKKALATLPRSSRRAVSLSVDYYYALFQKLCHASPETIKHERLRLPNYAKTVFLIKRILS